MSFTNPAFRILRHSVEGMEGMHCKMFDPPKENPDTPDLVAPTNPVPEVMAMAGFQDEPSEPHTVQRDLMHGDDIDTWDGKKLLFFLFRDKDNDALDGNYPGATIRIPRGAIFHSETSGHGPPPHTIHWHGIEPTPMNDGVGHCSVEIGDYTYQFQPNFIGTYFYHCHRNTVQHFEYGLFGLLIVDPADAFFATLANPAIPIGAGRDGKRRTAANTSLFPQFPGFNPNAIDSPDPLGQFSADPHAMTVPYDIEAFWVLDDRDSVWADLAPDARATFPKHGNIPGVNDNFRTNAGGSIGPDDFFAFHDFNADYWFVSGVPVPGYKGSTAQIPANIVIPPEFNSGVSGTQVSINAKVDQTILIRCLNAAYNCTTITFPVDVVIIAWDGRALGVPPFGQYSEATLLPANTPIRISTARRFDALIRVSEPVNDFAKVEFSDTRRLAPGISEEVLMTALIPINISENTRLFNVSGTVTNTSADPVAGVAMALTGPVNTSVTTNASGNYSFAGLPNGDYVITPSFAGFEFSPPNRSITVAGTNVSGQDFVALQIPPGFTVSGKVSNLIDSSPVAGLAITLTGPVNASTVSDSSGDYRFHGLVNGRYVITPSSSGGSSIIPLRRMLIINGVNVNGQNFKVY